MAVTKSQRLRPVTRYVDVQEQQAAKLFVSCRQAFEQAQCRLEELKTYRNEYAQQFVTAGMQGFSVAQMRSYRAFLEKLDKAIAHQDQVVGNAKREMDQKKRQWLERRSRKQALETVVAHYQSEEAYSAAKAEQRETDDRPVGNARDE